MPDDTVGAIMSLAKRRRDLADAMVELRGRTWREAFSDWLDHGSELRRMTDQAATIDKTRRRSNKI